MIRTVGSIVAICVSGLIVAAGSLAVLIVASRYGCDATFGFQQSEARDLRDMRIALRDSREFVRIRATEVHGHQLDVTDESSDPDRGARYEETGGISDQLRVLWGRIFARNHPFAFNKQNTTVLVSDSDGNSVTAISVGDCVMP